MLEEPTVRRLAVTVSKKNKIKYYLMLEEAANAIPPLPTPSVVIAALHIHHHPSTLPVTETNVLNTPQRHLSDNSECQ